MTLHGYALTRYIGTALQQDLDRSIYSLDQHSSRLAVRKCGSDDRARDALPFPAEESPASANASLQPTLT
ncbi:hypothetical protein VTN96DRAFT_2454 [Rasamsonia emersonii]